MQTEIRHENNMQKVNENNEKLAKESEERIFQKYVGFYWQKKSIEKNLNQKNAQRKNKLEEKAEKIEELERANEERRKKLIKKLQNMENKKLESEKEKNEKILREKKIREEKMEKCKGNLDLIQTEENARRQDILDYQNEVMARCVMRDNNLMSTTKSKSDKSVVDQMIIERNMGAFNKKVSELKEQSILAKTEEERVKMYKEVKKEEERKKKELEEEQMLSKNAK